jgi:hypothetical protein
VSTADGVLRDATRSITELTDAVSRLLMRQEALDGSLAAVAGHQAELGAALGELEGSVDRAFEARAGVPPGDADLQREQA